MLGTIDGAFDGRSPAGDHQGTDGSDAHLWGWTIQTQAYIIMYSYNKGINQLQGLDSLKLKPNLQDKAKRWIFTLIFCPKQSTNLSQKGSSGDYVLVWNNSINALGIYNNRTFVTLFIWLKLSVTHKSVNQRNCSSNFVDSNYWNYLWDRPQLQSWWKSQWASHCLWPHIWTRSCQTSCRWPGRCCRSACGRWLLLLGCKIRNPVLFTT